MNQQAFNKYDANVLLCEMESKRVNKLYKLSEKVNTRDCPLMAFSKFMQDNLKAINENTDDFVDCLYE